MTTNKQDEPDLINLSLDEAVQSFKMWAEGNGGIDELEFKEYLWDVWLPKRFIERSRVRNGWNARGEKV